MKVLNVAACLVSCLVFGLVDGHAGSARAAESATGNVSGPAALALAGVVGVHSAVLGSYDRRIMARLLGGNIASYPPTRKVSVIADAIACRVSNVDIITRSCELTFGTGKRHLTGREANEVFATLAAAGVVAEGAAGSMIESVTKLNCTVDPNEIKQKAGGGASCSFMPGQ